MIACQAVEQPDRCIPRCEQNDLLTCDEARATVRVACGAERCAADAPIPRCVPASALPCDPEQPPPAACENGRKLECDLDSGYLLTTNCPPGAVCVAPSALCLEAESISCDESWNPICVNGQRFSCDPATEQVVSTPSTCD